MVYLDETWANAHDGKKKAWVETDTTTKGTIGGVPGADPGGVMGVKRPPFQIDIGKA